MKQAFIWGIQVPRDYLIQRFTLIGDIFYLLFLTLKSTFSRPFYFTKLLEQIRILGGGSLSITVVIGLTMGLVMTINFGYGLTKFGGVLYVPAVVSVSLAREMAPLFTSLLIAGRIGSGMASEIGSMTVTEQIDAIRALGTSPIRTLVVPRFLASIISLPLLTSLSFSLGILGGMIVCVNEFDLPAGLYFNKVLATVKMPDFISGLVKSSIFGAIIALVGCYRGLTTKDGTKGVGESATWVVVTSSICILITDFFISKLFIVFWT
jgi:phospholipid/cholesterol/gamma-HCH transport system permease protein